MRIRSFQSVMNSSKEAHIVRRAFAKATLLGGVAVAAVVALAIPAGATITAPAANATVSGTVTLTSNGAQAGGCSDLGGLSTSNGSVKLYVDQGAGTANGTVVAGPAADTGTSTVFFFQGAGSTASSNPATSTWVSDNYGNGTYTFTAAEQAAKSTLGIICGSGTLTNNKETITVNNTGSLVYGGATTGAPGQVVTVKATLTDQNGIAPANGQVVTFAVPGQSNVTATTVNGVATTTLTLVGPPVTGTLTASTPSGYFSAASTTQAFTVTKEPTTTTLSPLPSSDYGNTDTYTATVASNFAGQGTPSGTVQFTEDGNNFGSPVTLSGSGVASITDSTLSAGSHTIGANYLGTSAYAASTATTTQTQVVVAGPTSTQLSSSVQPSFFGETIIYTATVTATVPGPTTGAPVGKVSFSTTPTGGSSEPIGGAVTLTPSGPNVSTASSSAISLLPANTYVSAAAYTPTAVPPATAPVNFAGSNSTFAQTINPAGTSVGVVSSLPAFSDFGQPVQFTATVTTASPGVGSPTGTVTFVVDQGTPNQIILGTEPLNTSGNNPSSATSPAIASLTPNNHIITATYTNSDGNYVSGTSGSIGQFVAPDATTTVISTVNNSNPSVFGQPVQFAATVTPAFAAGGTPTGVVFFYVNGSDPPSCTSPPTPTYESTLVNGVATTPADAVLAVGDNTVSACYLSSSSDFGAGGTNDPQYVQVVNGDPTTTTLTSANAPDNSSGPSVWGQPVTFTASVAANAPGAGTPLGTVTFTDGSNLLGTVTLSGGTSSDTASVTTAALTVGSHAIEAVYNPDGVDFLTSQNGLNHTVNQAQTSTTVTQNGASVQGQPVSFTATINAVAPGAGAPTGTVEFEINGANILGPPVVLTPSATGSTATSETISSLTPGTYAATAIYSGDVDFLPSADTLNQIVNPASTATTLTATPSPDTFGAPVSLTATVTPTGAGAGLPTGTVDFYDGATLLGASAVSTVGGVQQASISGLTPAVGSHSLSAVYLGEYDYAGSTAATITEAVNVIGTTTSVVSSLNPSAFGSAVTFTATVTPASNAGPGPSGTITFTDGSTTLGTATLTASGHNSVASLTVSSLAVGAHSINATYSGAADYAGSTTATALTQTVNKAATTLVAAQATTAGVVSATLSSAQGPLAGQTINFTVGTTALCSAVTGSNGTATCTAGGLTNLTLQLSPSYTATYAGNGSYLGQTATGKA
jgi:hypothetical protein